MGYRRKSRELAMQALFYMDMAKCYSDENLLLFCQVHQPPEKARPFFIKLVKGVNYTRTSIDAAIVRHSDNWKIDRMSSVDRNVMRIAVFEMAFCQDIPHKVSINEAIDIGKNFGYEESGAFINGILDSIHIALQNNEIDMQTEIPDTVFNDTILIADAKVGKDSASDSSDSCSVPQKPKPCLPVSTANATIRVTSQVRKRIRRPDTAQTSETKK